VPSASGVFQPLEKKAENAEKHSRSIPLDTAHYRAPINSSRTEPRSASMRMYQIRMAAITLMASGRAI
jgi:hypothetical protein